MTAPAARTGTPIPYGLLRRHGAMFGLMLRMLPHAVGQALRPARARAAAIAAIQAGPAAQAIRRTIAPPPASLVESYIDWCGAAGRHEGLLPPHMVSQWSLPLVVELLLRLPLRLTGVINQGVALRVHGPLPRGVPLHLAASVETLEQADGRIKLVVLVTTGAGQQARLVEARLHLSFLLPGKRPPRAARAAVPDWREAGVWRAEADDGLRFALLTGDFNPIHWCGPLARRSVFGGMVLHGFGSLVRSYELAAPGGCKEIEVRFLRPVPLPAGPLSVQLADMGPDGRHPLRLIGADGTVHLLGAHY